MNLLLLEPEEVAAGGRVRLDDRRAEHLRRVLKVEPGKRLRAGVIGGAKGQAEVLACSSETVELRLELETPRGHTPWADLILALPRPAVLHRLLQAAASFGLGRLHLVRSWRVEKSFFSSPALRPESIRKHLLLGAEQGMLTHLPEVQIHHRLLPVVEGFREERATGLRILAHPQTEACLESLYGDPETPGALAPAVLAIGPEGGWIDREVASFEDAGFQAVSLGSSVLRVETAVAVALGQIQLLRRQTRRRSNLLQTC